LGSSHLRQDVEFIVAERNHFGTTDRRAQYGLDQPCWSGDGLGASLSGTWIHL